MAQLGFDVSSTKPQAAFDPIPPGWYAMRINKADVVVGQKAGTGEMLKVEFEVIEHAHPDQAGRRVFANFCHQHDNKQTRDIARAQIAAIGQSIGKPSMNDTEEMLGGELRVKVGVQPAKDGYDARNEVKGFKALSDVDVAAPAASTPAAKPAQASAPAASKQPWKR